MTKNQAALQNEAEISWIRPVKVKTLGKMTDAEVEAEMKRATLGGFQSTLWEEVPDEDTPKLNLTQIQTITKTIDGVEKSLEIHQTTVPIPMDAFPNLWEKTEWTAVQAFSWATEECRRRQWTQKYPDLMAALNDYDMEAAYLY